MAATIATAYGMDKSRTKETHRLGSVRASVEAATWHTKATATVHRDGDARVSIQRPFGTNWLNAECADEAPRVNPEMEGITSLSARLQDGYHIEYRNGEITVSILRGSTWESLDILHLLNRHDPETPDATVGTVAKRSRRAP